MSTTGTATAPNGASTPTIALLENLPDAILLLDEDGAIGYANAAAERLFGRPVAELYGDLFTTWGSRGRSRSSGTRNPLERD